MLPGTYWIELSSRGHVPVEIERHELVLGSEPLVIELEPARAVTVDCVDAAGRELTPARAELRTFDGEPVPGGDLAPGRAQFATVPHEPVELELQIGTRTWHRSIAASEGGVRMELPVHGELRLQLETLPELSEDFVCLKAHLTGPEAGDQGTLELWFKDDAELPLELQTELLPGSYDLTLELEETAGARVLHERVPFDIEAGELRELRLD